MTDQTFFWRVSVQTEAVFNSLTRPIIENLIPPPGRWTNEFHAEIFSEVSVRRLSQAL